jgi:hypothetical protein
MLRLPIDEIAEIAAETLDIPPAAMGMNLKLQIIGRQLPQSLLPIDSTLRNVSDPLTRHTT